MTPDLLALAHDHAAEVWPAEACALVVVQPGSHLGQYVRVKNIAHEPDRFAIHPEDWARAEDRGRVAGMVHSHKDTPNPSPADLVACDLSEVPWLIVAPSGQWQVLQPRNRAFERREFVWGLDDCYSLVRDWYSVCRHWNLPDFVREPDFWRSRDLFGESLHTAGFKMVEGRSPEKGDCLIFDVHGKRPDHCAVYLGAGRLLHQPMGGLSIVEPIGRLAEKLAYIARRAA